MSELRSASPDQVVGRVADHDRLAFSPTEVAEAFGVSRQHVQNLIARGELPSFKFGRSRLIPASVVDELLSCDGTAWTSDGSHHGAQNGGTDASAS